MITIPELPDLLKLHPPFLILRELLAMFFLNDTSCADSILEEVADLRQQLQAMKKQAVTVMEQSRKSSDREQAALRQAQEVLELKESTTANASRAAQRENYMLDLMTDASQDMAGMLLLSC